MLEATTSGASRTLESGSEAEFITEHYWGYTKQRDGGTLEIPGRTSSRAGVDGRVIPVGIATWSGCMGGSSYRR